MSTFIQHFGTFIQGNPGPAFLAIFFAALCVGNVAGFTALWVAFKGYLGPWGILLTVGTLFAADIAGDFLWYSLGHYLTHTKFAGWIKLHLRFIPRLETKFQKNSTRLIFISKFIYGSSFPILFTAGWTKVPFRKYFETSLLAVISWMPVLVVLAYALFSSLSLVGAQVGFHRIELLFVFGLGVFIILDFLLSWVIRLITTQNGDRNGNGSKVV